MFSVAPVYRRRIWGGRLGRINLYRNSHPLVSSSPAQATAYDLALLLPGCTLFPHIHAERRVNIIKYYEVAYSPNFRDARVHVPV